MFKKYFIQYAGSRHEDKIDEKIRAQIQSSSRNASSFRDNYDLKIKIDHRDLRVQITNDYIKNPKTLTDLTILPDLASIVEASNIPYNNRLRSWYGIYYADDFVKMLGDNYNWIKLSGVTNTYYWDISKVDSIFYGKDGILPSDALNAFFAGPTFADCANVILASVYQLIQNQLGIRLFNQVFGNPISQFIISKYLYSEQTKSLDVDGNPLFFLFDYIENPRIDELENGDIVYIKGVEDYFYKHLAGFAPGWNLIVVKEEDQEIKFIGYGPDSFSNGPITFIELKKILINYYNQDRSKETLEKIDSIKKYPDIKGLSSHFPSDEHHLKNVQVELSESLANDKKDMDDRIGGLSHAIRFNQTKLNQFVDKVKRYPGWNNIESNSLKGNVVSKSGKKISKINLSQENLDSTFANYDIGSESQQDMYDTFLRFGNAIINLDEYNCPLGLVISGKAGIGKTHLSIAVMKYVNKNVLLVDEKYISDNFQKGSFNARF